MTISKIDELQLIARVRAFDDRRAFRRLVEANEQHLRRFLMGLTGGDAATVDDIAQEAFIKAYVNLSSFKATARFSTWLTTIAVREYYNWIRRSSEELLNSDYPESDSDDSDERTFQDSHDINMALRVLSPIDRSIVLMHYFEDIPLKKIAKTLSLEESAVRVRLHRARKRMRQALDE